MSSAKVLFGFHAVGVRLKTAPASVIEVYIDPTRRDARMKQFLARAREAGARLIEADGPRLAKLAERHPQLVIDVRLEDHLVDLVAEGVDIAIRAGAPPPDSTAFVAQPIFTMERVLVAAGRTPRTPGLGLDALGVDGVSDGDWLPVDDTMLVEGTDWLYGVGDVNHRALLTHQGKYQARAAGDVIAARALGRPVDDAPWGAHVATADHCAVPQVVFSDPQVASVGLTVAEAERAGRAVRAVDVELGGIAGAATHADGYRGTARAVIDTERGILVGATIVGRDVEELVQAVTIAVVGEVPLHRLRHAVPAYPTVSELWLRWLEALQRAGGAQ